MPLTTARGYVYPVPADPADGAANLQALAASVDTDVSVCLPDAAITTFGDIGAFVAGSLGTGGLGAINDALVGMIRPKVTITPTKFVWWCTTQSGNYDVGIINFTTRARLWSLGSTACPATGEVVVNIVGGPTLTAGTRYGLVFAANNITVGIVAGTLNPPRSATLYDGTLAYGLSSSAFPIPATLPAWAADTSPPALALRA